AAPTRRCGRSRTAASTRSAPSTATPFRWLQRARTGKSSSRRRVTTRAAPPHLAQVLTPAAYEHLERINERILAGCSRVIEDHSLPGYAIGIAAKGCVTFSAEPIVDYATFKANQG